jgi:hypothetical protein
MNTKLNYAIRNHYIYLLFILLFLIRVICLYSCQFVDSPSLHSRKFTISLKLRILGKAQFL